MALAVVIGNTGRETEEKAAKYYLGQVIVDLRDLLTAWSPALWHEKVSHPPKPRTQTETSDKPKSKGRLAGYLASTTQSSQGHDKSGRAEKQARGNTVMI